MGARSAFGLLGPGDASVGMTTCLAARGIGATTWALPDHVGANSLHYQGQSRQVSDSVDNLSAIHSSNKAASLEELVKSHDILVLTAPTDAHELYITALEELNHLLQDAILLIINGNESTLHHAGRLKVKCVVDSSLFTAASKLAVDLPAVDTQALKDELELTRSPLGHDDLARLNLKWPVSEVVRSLLHDLALFNAKVQRQETSLEDVLGFPGLQKDRLIESFAHIAELGRRDRPVVTMFSGGLDSTYLLLILQQLGFSDVHAVAINVGAPVDEVGLANTAAHFGAKFVCLDGCELFIEKGVIPAIRAHAKYLGMYPISSSLSRPVIARLTTEYAKAVNAGLLLHTANLSQNSLPRLNNSIQSNGFSAPFGSPYVRSVISREEKAKQLAVVGLTMMSHRKLSGDENLWVREFEGGPLDDPQSFNIPEDAYQWTAHCSGIPAKKFKLTFEKGSLVSVNDKKIPLIEAITMLNREVGKYGHGRFIGLEPIKTDQKVLEVREAPAAAIIMDALRHLEVATLESKALNMKQYLEQKWTEEAISGHWGSTCHTMCDAAIASALIEVGGNVTYIIDHRRYLPCSIVATNPRYIRDRDRWEYEESLRAFNPEHRF